MVVLTTHVPLPAVHHTDCFDSSCHLRQLASAVFTTRAGFGRSSLVAMTNHRSFDR